MKVFALLLCLVLVSPGEAGTIRLPLGNGRCLRVKGHVRALKRSAITVQTNSGFSAWSAGARY